MKENNLAFNINNTSDNITPEEVLILNKNISLGYNFPLTETAIEFKDLNKLKELLKNNFSDYKEYSFNSKNNISVVIYCKECILNIVGDKKNVYINPLCKSIKDAEDLFRILKSFFVVDTDVDVHLTNYYLVNGTLNEKINIYTEEDYKHLSKEYYPYIDTDSMFEQFLSNKESILICCGIPGVGKSKMVGQLLKYSIENPSKIPYNKMDDFNIEFEFVNAAYVKSTEILSMDIFWEKISNEKYDLVILDDLDYFLTSRANETYTEEEVLKNKFLSQLLSFTDGIEENKTKFIITSNQPFEDIDQALLRKGRLFDIIELRELKQDEALKIWLECGLTKKKFQEQKFSETILQADLGSLIAKLKNTSVKIQDYLLEKGISKLYNKTKKLGF